VIGDDTVATRRHLPHLQYHSKTYFVTFVTRGRFVLPYAARDLAYETIVFEHRRSCYLHCAVVMPDHVHALLTPLDEWTVPRIERRMKGLSAWRINGLLSRSGALWLSESFDRALRCDDDLVRKADYICANPVRAGLVEREEEYRWIWRAWKDEEGQARMPVLHGERKTLDGHRLALGDQLPQHEREASPLSLASVCSRPPTLQESGLTLMFLLTCRTLSGLKRARFLLRKRLLPELHEHLIQAPKRHSERRSDFDP
jgi:REP element-mobilizing transposase RayT